jgi:hypothetical protein
VKCTGRSSLARATVGTCIALASVLAPTSAFAKGSETNSGARPAFSLAIRVYKNVQTAGYVSEQAGIVSVSTSFEVPEITTCTSGENAGMGPVVILLGNRYFVGAGAEAECQNGVTSYIVAISVDGKETHPLTVAAEDLISVAVTVGAAAVSIKIDDLTSKETTSEKVLKGKVTSAELGDDSLYQGKHEVPIPRFTDHQFTDARINGRVLSKAVPLLADVLVNGKTILIAPGAISKAGDSFVMHFVHAS